MRIIRESLTKKAIFLFTILVVILLAIAIALFRAKIMTVPLSLFLIILIALLLIVLGAFLLDVVVPVNNVAKEVRNLLAGRQFKRPEPITIDEIGMFTHFFNEITHDLEKISYDIKERKRMSSELDIAAQIQRDVLPKKAPDFPGLDIVAKTRSAAEIGGDSFDFLSSQEGGQTFIYIGDVTGHGVPSGLIMMMVDTLIHSMIAHGLVNAKDILVHTNTLLTPRISNRLFMTLVMLRWDSNTQKMYYAGAGHEHVLVYKAKSGKAEAFRSGGIALGMISDNSKIIQEKEIQFEVGDTIVLYTDGLTEAKNTAGEMYGLQRMIKSIEKYGYLPSSESIFDHITQDFAGFVGEYIQTDDTTMIVIKYIGKEASARTKLVISAEETSRGDSKIWRWGN